MLYLRVLSSQYENTPFFLVQYVIKNITLLGSTTQNRYALYLSSRQTPNPVEGSFKWGQWDSKQTVVMPLRGLDGD